MNIFGSINTQARVWNAYAALGVADEAARQQAMQTLREAGSASLPALRMALYMQGPARKSPRAQFAAAVVLHKLGDPAGLEALTDALQWRLPTNPGLAPELEAAFIAIGAPDAVTPLLDLWKRLPKQEESRPVLASICRVWATLRDPRALDALIVQATRLPDLFEFTVPAFGEMAVAPLERMAREEETERRLLAIRTLRLIVTARSFAALVPLLRDDSSPIRGAATEALAVINANAAVQAVAEAMQAGYSTPEAVALLGRASANPTVFPLVRIVSLLLALIERWQPSAPVSGDTEEAVLAAVRLLRSLPHPSLRYADPLCGLLERQPSPALAAVTIGALGDCLPTRPELHARAHRVLYTYLASVAPQTQTEAARALAALGDRIGFELLELLNACWLQSNLLDRLQTFLRGGADANALATQAAQQVTRWFQRLSKEAADRFASASAPVTGSGPAQPTDSRLSSLLRQLVSNALLFLKRCTPEEVEEVIALTVAAIRALNKLGDTALREARTELLAALRAVRLFPIAPFNAPFGEVAPRDQGQPVRAAAAQALIQAYGPDSFVFFLEALYVPEKEVVGTALIALGRLGDLRAVTHLQPIASDNAHPHQAAALEALAAIRRIHPEAMSLLRASSASDARPDTLLRPASGNNETVPADQLLRSSAPGT